MNTKRQTVWLVSMLGLMVVLSAYYLFTDEVEEVPVASEESTVGQIEVNGVELMDPTAVQEHMNLDQIAALVDDQPDASGLEAADGSQAADETQAAEESQSAGDTQAAEQSLKDEQVLEQLNGNLTAEAAITTMQMNRNTEFSRQLEELTMAVTDATATEEQIEEAINKQDALIDMETKLIALEEKLLADYENAVVTYDNAKNHYTVNVAAAELEKSEAVSIVRTAIEDLGIAVHQISVRLFR